MKAPPMLNNTEIRLPCLENITGDKYYVELVPGKGAPAAVQVILGTMIAMTTVVSILGNLVTCVIVYRKTAMRSAINLLLTNMAFADLALATTVMPFFLCGLLKSSIHCHVVVCMVFSILKDIFTGVVCYTMLVVSMDRYMIIAQRREGVCPKVAKRTVVIIWIICSMVTLPQLISLQGYQHIYHDHTLCGQYVCRVQTFSVLYSNLLVCVLFFIPVAAMLYFYLVVLQTVRKRSSTISDHPGRNVCVSVTQYSCKLGLPTMAVPVRFSGDFNAKRRAFSTVLLMFIALLVCWSPYTVNRVVLLAYRARSYDTTLTSVFLCIGLFKSCLYPVIYYFRNNKFRAACQLIVPSLKKLSVKFYTSKQRRVNPRSLYECSSADTRI